MKHADFRELLTLAVKDNCFVFQGHLYVQKDGVAIGSPLELVLANIILCHLERKFMENYSTFPLYYRRYVDDTFCVFNSYDELLIFCTLINTIHPNVKFTMEVENAGQI